MELAFLLLLVSCAAVVSTLLLFGPGDRVLTHVHVGACDRDIFVDAVVVSETDDSCVSSERGGSLPWNGSVRGAIVHSVGAEGRAMRFEGLSSSI